MTEELNKELLEVLKSTTETVGEAKDFILSELPDVVYQLLLWYGVYHFIIFMVSLVLIYTTYKIYKFALNQYKLRNEDKKKSFFWDNDYMLSVPAMIILLTGWSPAFIGLFSINIIWLKIWIAPKVWLIGYVGSLAK